MLARLGDQTRAEKWLRRAWRLEEDFLYARVTLIQMWPATVTAALKSQKRLT